MAFKLINPPYDCDNTPIYQIDMEDGIMGKANNNGSIVINKDLDPSKVDEVVSHEKIHLEQMKRGDLHYDDENVTWKGKKYPRASMKEGAKNLPWETEAYKRG
tara:strand:- start:139 stop:447 length:309 start_codon:yes stop_codon:yes gene_type:complete